ncbi:MAG: hypothetical protein AAGA23_18465 [Pseudomonadota bacterium]
MRILLTLGLLLTFKASAQELEISGAELVSGDARALLETFALEAGNQTINVSAPARWHGLIREQMTGAQLNFEDRDDSAIRIWLPNRQSQAPVGPAPEAPEVDVGSAETAGASLKADARRQVQGQAPQIPGAAELLGNNRTLTPDLGAAPGREPVKAPAEPAPPPATEEPAPAAAETAAAEVVAPAPVEPVAAAEPVDETPASAPADEPEARTETPQESLQRRLNRGREITRSLTAAELKPRDLLFVTDGVVAVVRPAGTRNRAYWLTDEIDLARPELSRERAGRYRVDRRLELAAGDAESPAEKTAAVDEDEKSRMERLYNNGRAVNRSLSIAALRPDDVLYVGNGMILVARRVQVNLKRYWLDGDLDLTLPELEKTGSRKYRVIRQIR